MPSPGQKWLHYQLVDKIGEGGMGVVWRATDTTLNREVALKLLPDLFSNDPERQARFEREAQLLASLSHPNIAAIHGLHVDGDRHFLAMELAPGEDLAHRLDRGAMDVDEVLEISRQIASGLAAAHESGIIHRDLKPANIKIAPDGSVKILDFGLAKAVQATNDSGSTDPVHSPTITIAGTADGVILGTAAYMSPEQARGRTLDRRTDLWSFGCVMFEMLTGQNAFRGETVSDTLAAILRGEPNWELIPADTPAPLQNLLRRCLTKDVSARWRDAGDVSILLGPASLAESGAIRPMTNLKPRPKMTAILLVAVVALLVGGILSNRFFTPESSLPKIVDAQLAIPAGYQPHSAEISPDGQHIAIILHALDTEIAAKGPRLVLRSIDDAKFRWVEAGLGSQTVQFSPDSREIAFVTRSHPGTKEWALVRAPLDDLSAMSLVTDWRDRWTGALGYTKNNEIVVFAEGQVLLFPIDGRPALKPVPVVAQSGSSFLPYGLLPSGELLGTLQDWDEGYTQNVTRLDPYTGEATIMVKNGFSPAWVEPNLIVFSRGDQLVVQPFDLAKNQATGGQRAADSGLRAELSMTAARFSLSSRGDLIHLTGGKVGLNRRLQWWNRDGTHEEWKNLSGAFTGWMDDSHDGRFIAFTVLGNANLFECWITEADQAALRPIIALPGMDCSRATLSPDGKWVAADCFGDTTRNGIYVAAISNSESTPKMVASLNKYGTLNPISWLPSGDVLIVNRIRENEREMLQVKIDEEGNAVGEATPMKGLPPRVYGIHFSPDERWVVITTFDGSGNRLTLASWDGQQFGNQRIVAQAEEIGADWLQKLPDGRLELLVFKDGLPYQVFVDTTGATTPLKLIENYAAPAGRSPSMTFLSDGRMLTIEKDPAEMAAGQVRIVTDWAAGFNH